LKTIIRHLATLVCLTFTSYAIAQSPTQPNALSARVLWVDYYSNHTDGFASADNYTFGGSLGYARNLNSFANLYIPFQFKRSKLPLNDDGDFSMEERNLFGLDVQGQFGDWDGIGRFKPYLLVGIGFDFISDESGVDIGFPIGGGFQFQLGQKSTSPLLVLQAEYRLVTDSYRNNFVYGLGINIPLKFGAKEVEPLDRDGDGVPDDQDRCIDVPGFPALAGCPDRDKDGFADIDDDCPDDPGIAIFMGCPDTDGDGLKDSDDECPTEAGPRSNRGCPINDQDGDGVLDADDLCPSQAGPASNRGCPEIDDTDQETLDLAAQQIYFETGEAKLLQQSFVTLNNIFDILQRYPAYKCAIGGHTDSVGNAAANQILSERRAKACYDYLVNKGISPNRLSFKGYGETQFIADNTYKEGREKNRRVEFNLFLE
jgi:outer membrane protein OmpA-like peptidoglycan-associated protein